MPMLTFRRSTPPSGRGATSNFRTMKMPRNRFKIIYPRLIRGQAMRLRTWQDVLQKLDSIPRAQLSPAEQLNYDIYRPQIQTLIASQKFRDYEMPANADTTFWTDLGYAARRPFRTVQEYRNWIAQMRDIPRYFTEQMDEMRQGMKRGFTPPRVTMKGRDASITAVTEATPKRACSTRLSRTCRACRG